MANETTAKTYTLRELREERGWTLTDCAELLKCSPAYLSRIERGLVEDIHYGVALQISEVFDVPIEDVRGLLNLHRLDRMVAHG